MYAWGMLGLVGCQTHTVCMLLHTFCQTPQKPMWMATPQSRAARANEMAECTDHQRPSAEQVPNESFWADQPGSHNLPSEVLSDVETEHCMTPCGA